MELFKAIRIVVRGSEVETCRGVTDRTTYSGGTTACIIGAAIGTGWSNGHRQVLEELAILEHKVGHYFNQRRCT